MIRTFEEFQKMNRDSVDLALTSFGNINKNMQTMAVEMAGYSKKSFEEGTAVVEKLANAKTVDQALEIQGNYLKSTYEGFMSQASRIGELYVDLARDVYKPVENAAGKTAK